MAYTNIRLARKQLVAANVEATRGTWAAPEVATDVYEVADLTWPTISGETISWDTMRNTLTRDPDAVKIGNITASFGFSLAMPVEPAATGAAGVLDTKRGLFFEACGCAASTSSVTHSITPSDAANSSLSMSFNVDGWEIRMRGCVGTFVDVWEAGQFRHTDFTFEGVVEDCLEATALAIGNIISVTPEKVENIAIFTINDGTNTMQSCARRVALSCGAVQTPYRCMSGDKGIGYYFTSDRVSGMEIICGPVHDGSANQFDDELWAAYEDSTAVTVQVAAATPWDSPGAQMGMTGTISDLQWVEEDGAGRWNITIAAASATANGEFEIQYEESAA